MSLVKLEQAERMLAEVATVEEALRITDLAEVARIMAKEAKLGTSAINHATVIKVRAERKLADIVDEGQERGQIAKQDAGGRNLPRPSESEHRQPATYADLGLKARQVSEARLLRDTFTDAQLVQMKDEADSEDKVLSRDRLLTSARQGTAHVSHNSGVSEWYTPKEYITAARNVMGSIDVDPASTAQANAVVAATAYFDDELDGLAHDWRGTVWMNPPYSAELVTAFADKLAQHVEAGDVTQACVLVNNATETAWFARLVSVASAVCFPRGRVKFWAPDGRIAAPLQGQAIIYIGENAEGFAQAFGEFGWTAIT